MVHFVLVALWLFHGNGSGEQAADLSSACVPRIKLRVDARSAFSGHETELRSFLESEFCAMRQNILRTGSLQDGRLAEVLRRLDGRKKTNIVWDERCFGQASAWLIPFTRQTLPFGKKSVCLSSETLSYAQKVVEKVVERKLSENEIRHVMYRISFIPRENFRYILLHELVHIAGFFLSTEETAFRIASHYYPFVSTGEVLDSP